MSLAVKPFIQEPSAELSHMLPSQTEHTHSSGTMTAIKSLLMVSITLLMRPQTAL